MSPYLFTFDNKMLISGYKSRPGQNGFGYFRSGNRERERMCLFETQEADIEGVDYSRKDKKLLSVTWTTDLEKEHFFDPEAEAMKKKLQEKLTWIPVGGWQRK